MYFGKVLFDLLLELCVVGNAPHLRISKITKTIMLEHKISKDTNI
jgi:hypothetical protein